MGKWLTILKSLGPKGKLNFFPGSNNEKLLSATSEELQRIETFFKNVQLESTPSTTVDMLSEWRDIYRINPDLTDQEIRDLAVSYYTSTGNQSKSYIDGQILPSFPSYVCQEVYTGSAVCGLMECGSPSAICGGVGTVVYVFATVTEDQEKELQRLIDYYYPAHLTVITLFERPQVNNPGAGIPFYLGVDGLGTTKGEDAP